MSHLPATIATLRLTWIAPRRTGSWCFASYLTRIRLRHEALLSRMEVRDRPSLRRRSGGAKAGGSLVRRSPGRVGAASTKSRRFGTAGRAERGERDEKVYERNRCCYASSRVASSNPVDVGWLAARTAPHFGWELRAGSVESTSGGHGECLRRSRGDAAGAQSDA